MSADVAFGKDQIDTYLKEVAKQYRKLNRKGMPAEITLIGGASILINYGFRDTTYDVDALIRASSSMKDAINYVTDTMVNIRTIAGEYLVAMKLRAFRQYKHDISDIVGILREHIRTGDPLTYERIDKAVHDLYDGWEHMPENAHSMIQSILADEDMDALYEAYAQEESAAKDALLTFDDKYPDVLKEDNLSDILSHLMAKQKEAAESE